MAETLEEMQKVLTAAADGVEMRRAAFLERPDDIETMHKFRVSMRTLRSLIAFTKPWQKTSQNAWIQSLLKEVVAYTSRLRELDVFETQACENDASSPEFLAFCAQEALAERQSVKQAISSKRLTKTLKKALDATRNIAWKKSVLANGLSQEDVRRRFDDMVSSMQADLDSLQLVDAERTHDIRKRAKRVRYAAERFKSILGEDAVGIAKGMVAHQDNLGALCDARANIALIREFLQRKLPDPVVWDLKLLRAQNETFLYSALKAERAAGDQN